MSEIIIKRATIEDIDGVNVIRKQVNDMHVLGEPKIFKPGFGEKMQSFIKTFLTEENKVLLVAKDEELIVGYAALEIIEKEETEYRYALRFLEVGELGVLEGIRQKGVGGKLMEEVKRVAKEFKINEVQLNMWSFNTGALEFYEKIGYETYRRHLRIKV